jgi:lipopolysaccharide/colanic/teichoic acid biosynthesis glycosyltransferase
MLTRLELTKELVDLNSLAVQETLQRLERQDLADLKPGPLYFVAKRWLDWFGAALLVLLSLPLSIVIAILIKIETPGPFFFTQERIGSKRRYKNGTLAWEIRTFRVYKFRTMFHNSDQSLHIDYIRAFAHNRAERSTEPGAQFKLCNDPRITRIGRLLRIMSLDELPQLLNILRGEMSLVGPRPVPIYEVAEYKPEHWQRMAALPGLTGLWQISARSQVPFDEMIRLDLEYVRRQSLWFDFKILLGTIPAVLLCRGAK